MMKISDPSIISKCDTSHDVEILFFLHCMFLILLQFFSWCVSRHFFHGGDLREVLSFSVNTGP